jgi:CRP/FNR family transcriptional regulator
LSDLNIIRPAAAASREKLLAQIALFAALDQAELALMASHTIEKRYSPGDILFHEGDPCSGLFLLASGRVKIVKSTPSGREIMLAIESAPSSVAEVPVFDGGPFPASVIALDPVTALHLPKPHFQSVCRQHPEVALKILAVTGRRLRQLVMLVEGVTFGSIRQRLARFLLEQHEESGALQFHLPVSHEEIALRLGTVREVVSRNLSRFQAENLIRVSRRDIAIVDLDGLRREAETEL